MNRSGRSVAQQAGFTLIELIMVVVILGVLSAFALPRFGNFRSNATEAAAQSARGAVLAAADLGHSQWLLSGGNANAGITMEGGTAVAITNGYPAGTNAGIVAALSRLDGFTPDNNDANTNVVFTSDEDNDCSFTYNAATVNNNVTVPPVVTALTAGCTN